MAQGAPRDVLPLIWTATAAMAIAYSVAVITWSSHVKPDQVKELTQSIIAILFVVGGGFLQVEQPTIDHSVIWAIVGSIVGFYFGAKAGNTSGP